MLEVSMLFLLCNLLWSGAPDSSYDMEIEVVGQENNNIYITPPNVMQDGAPVKKYDYAPVVFSKMVLNKKTANYYYDANINGIYNKDTINAIKKRCNYIKEPIKCANKNDHWVLTTDIQISYEKAYISMTLYDENSVPIASSTVSKKLKREVIPHKTQTSDTNMNAGNQGINVTRQTAREEKPIVLNFPAIIDSADVNQAVQLLYNNLQ